MLNSSYLARRLLRSKVLGVSAQRNMSALLVPLAQKDQMPFELRTTEQTDAEIAVLQQEFKEFNARCAEELKEMNQNRITNIIERGGVEGWDTAADLAYLQKSFTFSSPLHAQYFVQNVGKFCSQQDHHPEWSVTDGGSTVNVRLTSHFANNKVTLFDFQLAEHMNQQFAISQKWYVKYPWVESRTMSSWKIVLGTFLFIQVSLAVGMLWGNPYPTETARGVPPQATSNRALIVPPFELSTGAINKEHVENYVIANVDSFAYKTNIFSVDKVI